jgi:hypothetical protein
MWKRGYSRIRDLAVRALYCKLAEPAKKTHLSTKDLTCSRSDDEMLVEIFRVENAEGIFFCSEGASSAKSN